MAKVKLQDIYAKHLLTEYGYPLWNPRPSNTLPKDYQERGLQVGDVGIVDPSRGFDVFFNICQPHNHRLHERHGIPPSLHASGPIPIQGNDLHVNSGDIPPGTVIPSNRVQKKRWPSDVLPNSDYEFVVEASEGAILILPEGAQLYDLTTKGILGDVAKKNAVDWYRFIFRKFGREISNGDLYLITGFYKARSWLLASFQDAPPNRPWSIKVARDSGNNDDYRWDYEFRTICKHWPLTGYNADVNQSIFLRGYKIALRNHLFWTLHPQVDVTSLCDPAKSSCFPVLDRLLSKFKKRKFSNLVHCPQLTQPFHYSDTINIHLLSQNPDASVAITHDTEWIALLKSGEIKPDQLVREGCLVSVLSKYSVDSYDGAVYFLIDGTVIYSSWIFYANDTGTNYEPQEHMISGTFEFSGIRQVWLVSGLEQVLGEGSVLVNREEQISSKPLDSGETTESSVPISPEDSRVIITGIRRDPLIGDPGWIQNECCVLVEYDGAKRRTRNKPIVAEEATEWDDLILLPLDMSTVLHLSICVLSLSISGGEKKETLYTVELTVEKLLDEKLIFFPLNGEDIDESSHPSLLFTTERKNLSDLEDSDPKSSEELLLLAKTAEGNEHWEDVIMYMKDIAYSKRVLTPEERNIFSRGYDNLITARRASWNTISGQEEGSEGNPASATGSESGKRDRLQLKGEIIKICKEVLDILGSYLVRSATSSESAVFYSRMIGDYHRYLSDFQVDAGRTQSIKKSLGAYEDAWNLAISADHGLRATHPTRLHLALNFSLFYHEVLRHYGQALRMARQALDDARTVPDEPASENDLNDLTSMRLLEECVARWKSDEAESEMVWESDSDSLKTIEKGSKPNSNVMSFPDGNPILGHGTTPEVKRRRRSISFYMDVEGTGDLTMMELDINDVFEGKDGEYGWTRQWTQA